MRSWLVTFLAASVTIVALSAQHGYTRAEVENGARFYQANCATCHGPNGDNVRGVSLLSGKFRRATSDEELVKIILGGIPDTAMPPNTYSDLEAGMIVAYLREMGSGGRVDAPAGDVARGKTIFDGKGQCTTCHGVGGAGSRTAPSLADVGAIRRPLELERSIVDPSAEIHTDFRSVRVVTRSGTTVQGRLLNQSTFSIQVLDTAERLRSFDTSDVREFTILRTSPMPSARSSLSAAELADLVTYLTSLRGQR